MPTRLLQDSGPDVRLSMGNDGGQEQMNCDVMNFYHSADTMEAEKTKRSALGIIPAPDQHDLHGTVSQIDQVTSNNLLKDPKEGSQIMYLNTSTSEPISFPQRTEMPIVPECLNSPQLPLMHHYFSTIDFLKLSKI